MCVIISFDFCAPPKDEMWRDSPTENLGQVVFGERIRPSIYKVLLENNSHRYSSSSLSSSAS